MSMPARAYIEFGNYSLEEYELAWKRMEERRKAMSCGTGRISRGLPPKTQQEEREDGLRFLNEPDFYRTAATEEYVEVMDYLKPERKPERERE